MRSSAGEARGRGGVRSAGGWARGFTLVELLVAVAVVALLLGLLLPSLGRARRSAMATECGSNIRQLSLASEMYASDHAGRFMPGAARIAARNLHRWHGTRPDAGSPFAARGGPITPYLEGARGSEAVRACPEFAPVLEGLVASGAGFERGCGGYGYNNAFIGVDAHEAAPGVWVVRDDRVGALRSMFARPVSTAVFADAAFFGAGRLIEYSFIEPARWPSYPEFRPDPSVHFRHGGRRASVAWLDGHVSSEARLPLPGPVFTEGDFEGEGLGWFGTTDDNRYFSGR